MAWNRLTSMFVAVLAVSCSSPKPEAIKADPSRNLLEDAVVQWRAAGIDRYLITAAETDETPEGGCRWTTEVHGPDIDSRWISTFDNECPDWDISIPALHEEIGERTAVVDASGGILDVGWGEHGVPTSIDFVPDDAESEGLSVTIAFEDLTGEPSVRTELVDARDRWMEASIGNYQLTIAEDRNYWAAGCVWTTVISEGEVTEAIIDPASTSSNCPETSGTTVEDLHDIVSYWADEIDQYNDPAFGEHVLNVAYNQSGVPETLTYDLANSEHEESSQQITFTPLP